MNINIVFFILISLLFITLSVMFFWVLSLKKEISELRGYHKKLFSRLTDVMKDMQSMTNATYGIGKQVNCINDQVKNLDARQYELDLRDQSDKPIQQAIALVEKGAQIEEVMASCNLSRGEAELLFRIHG